LKSKHLAGSGFASGVLSSSSTGYYLGFGTTFQLLSMPQLLLKKAKTGKASNNLEIPSFSNQLGVAE